MNHAPPQTKKMSWTETMTNTAIGYTINQTAQIIVFPLVGVHVPLSINFTIGVIFTFISVARGYVLRRVFEWWRVTKSFA